MYTMCCDISNYFVKKAQFCHIVRGPWIFTILKFCQKCSILSFCESAVDFFDSSILSKMLHFVISWEDCWFCRFFNFVKNAPFCHCVRGSCIFSRLQLCQKYSVFVILWEDRGFFQFFNFVKTAQFCHFQRGPWIFFLQFCQKFCHLWKVDFKLFKYTICTLCVVIYQTILSKRLNFVRGPWIFTIHQFWCSILSFCESDGFFRFFNFVKNAPFCHFVRCPCIFSRLQFCQKCSILSLCERTVDFYAYSILSKMLNFVILWEDRGMFRFFNFVKNAQFCHFQRGLWIFSLFQVCQKLSILSFVKSGLQISILSKVVHFVICEKWTSNFNFVKNCPFCHLWKVDFKLWDKYKYTCVHYVLWYMKLFCQKGSILSLSERPV